MANTNPAQRLLNADHHRMILLLHSEGKTDAEIRTWLSNVHHIEISRLAVNRLRRRLQGQAPPASHTLQNTAAAAAAALAAAQQEAEGLSLSELLEQLLRARWAAAMSASRAGDHSAAAGACRDFIGLATLTERIPLAGQSAASSSPPWTPPTFGVRSDL